VTATTIRTQSYLAGFDAGRAVGAAEGYRHGHVVGYDRGHADGRAEAILERAAEDDTERAALCREVAARADQWVPADVLAERRREHEHARRLRALFEALEIVPPPHAPSPAKLWVDAAMVARCEASWAGALAGAA